MAGSRLARSARRRVGCEAGLRQVYRVLVIDRHAVTPVLVRAANARIFLAAIASRSIYCTIASRSDIFLRPHFLTNSTCTFSVKIAVEVEQVRLEHRSGRWLPSAARRDSTRDGPADPVHANGKHAAYRATRDRADVGGRIAELAPELLSVRRVRRS
jgi:hypothetical protein